MTSTGIVFEAMVTSGDDVSVRLTGFGQNTAIVTIPPDEAMVWAGKLMAAAVKAKALPFPARVMLEQR